MALYDTRYGLPQSMVDYLNQGLPSIYQPPTVDPIDSQPIEDEEDQVLEQLYPQNYQGSGDGGGPFNISANNPNVRTSRNYRNPFPFNPDDNLGFSDYGYIDPPKEGLAGLFEAYVKGSPLMRLAGKGLDALGNMIPPSKAGIFQNELLGGGFMLDNTGRIVTNNYNTPEGIMAGYNPVSGGLLNAITGGKMGEPTTYGLDKAYDKRRETISKTLKDKYGMTDKEIEAAIAGEYEGDVPINPATGLPTDLINRLGLFNQSQNLLNKKLSAADIIFNRKVEERREKAIEKQNQQRIARETRQKAEAARKNQTYTGGSDRQNVVDRNTGRRDATGGDRGSKGASDRFSNKSGRGRTGY